MFFNFRMIFYQDRPDHIYHKCPITQNVALKKSHIEWIWWNLLEFITSSTSHSFSSFFFPQFLFQLNLLSILSRPSITLCCSFSMGWMFSILLTLYCTSGEGQNERLREYTLLSRCIWILWCMAVVFVIAGAFHMQFQSK